MKKKFKFNIKGFFNKKENIAIMAVAVVFCAGLVVTNVKANDIPLHDGDILVDSQNVSQADPSEDAGSDAGTNDDTDQTTSESDGNTFTEKRANLELERNDLIAKYDQTIKNSTNDAEKKNAVKQKEKLTGYMEQEVSVESKIKAKNLPDCLVIITDSSVTVTVDEQNLKQNTVAKICNIIMEETQRTADKIVIQSSY